MMARSLLGRSGRRIATGLQIGAATAGFFGLNSLFGGDLMEVVDQQRPGG